jgi:hypothetical protein
MLCVYLLASHIGDEANGTDSAKRRCVPQPSASAPNHSYAVCCAWQAEAGHDGPVQDTAALLPDRLWDLVESLLPAPIPRPRGGRPRLSDRACLTGIVFVLRSDIPWQMLPKELGCGSGMSCWRRLRDWQQAFA